jgi:hypothetical protein
MSDPTETDGSGDGLEVRDDRGQDGASLQDRSSDRSIDATDAADGRSDAGSSFADSCACCVVDSPTVAGVVTCLASDQCVSPQQAPCDRPQLAPFLRYYSWALDDHVYSTQPTEFGIDVSGYGFERVEGFIFTTPEVGSAPYYRYWDGSHHFNSTEFIDDTEAGARDRTLLGYVPLSPSTENTARLYHYMFVPSLSQFYTTNYSEVGPGNSGLILEPDVVYLLSH